MFTPITELTEELQMEVLNSLDVPVEWEMTWDIGLTDPGDSYAVRPLWGRVQVAHRWPAAFPLGHRADPRSWRVSDAVPHGYRCPHQGSIALDSIGVHPAAGRP